jgi:predicted nicotinamide N-methyase
MSFSFNFELLADGSGAVSRPQFVEAQPSATVVSRTDAAIHRFTFADLATTADNVASGAGWHTTEPQSGLRQFVAAPEAAVNGSVDEASGQQLWECAVDLVAYLARDDVTVKGRRVLELGCGHGLPGVWCLARGEAASVMFQDNSEQVLRTVTAQTVALNTTPEQRERASFVSGDWRDLAKSDAFEAQFDLVLGAECTYSHESTSAFVAALRRALAPNGIALIATKTLYFGVGGGTLALRLAVEQSRKSDDEFELQVDNIMQYADFKSNVRDLLRVSWVTRNKEER